jgi:hypothetical protein
MNDTLYHDTPALPNSASGGLELAVVVAVTNVVLRCLGSAAAFVFGVAVGVLATFKFYNDAGAA